MVVVSYSGKEINAKLVYYGAGLSGKTTNLESIYEAVPDTSRGKMVSMKTQSDRTLFFDLLPLDLGEIMGFKTRFLLYTVPGQVFYNATRKLVLKGADAIVFVADSEVGKMEENKESLANLRANLSEYGLDLDQTPWVMQYNKRDLPNVYTLDELNAELNPGGKVPFFEAVATKGQGVFETFRGISHMLMEKVTRDLRRGPAGTRSSAPAPSAAATPPVPTMPAAPELPGAPVVADAPAALPTAAPGIAPGQAIEQEVRETAPALDPVGNADLNYGSELDLPAQIPASPEPIDEPAVESVEAPTPEPVHAAAPVEPAPKAPAEPVEASLTPAPPVHEPAGLDTPVSAGAPSPAPAAMRSEPVLDGPSLEQPPASTPTIEEKTSSAPVSAGENEIIVPVSLPKGASREIVLRIVIQNEE